MGLRVERGGTSWGEEEEFLVMLRTGPCLETGGVWAGVVVGVLLAVLEVGDFTGVVCCACCTALCKIQQKLFTYTLYN